MTRLKNHELRRARRLIIIEGTLGSLMNQLTTGILLIKFASVLGAGPTEIAVLVAVQQFVSALQVLSSWAIGRTGECKRVALIFTFLQRLTWTSAGLSLLFWIRPGTPGAVTMLIVTAAVAMFSQQMVLVAWYTWVADLAPVRFWGRFIGRKNMIALLFATPAGIGVGLFADWWFRSFRGDIRGAGG